MESLQKWFNENIAMLFTETSSIGWNEVLDLAAKDGIWVEGECDETHDMLYKIYDRFDDDWLKSFE